jgi:hypothetical protein
VLKKNEDINCSIRIGYEYYSMIILNPICDNKKKLLTFANTYIYIYKIMAVMKVETDIITGIIVNQRG